MMFIHSEIVYKCSGGWFIRANTCFNSIPNLYPDHMGVWVCCLIWNQNIGLVLPPLIGSSCQITAKILPSPATADALGLQRVGLGSDARN